MRTLPGIRSHADGITLDDAYQRCEEITRAAARNFAYGIRLLPEPKRRGMSALYAMARRIDDIGDGTAGADEKLTGLEAVRSEITSISADPSVHGEDPVLMALADASMRFSLPMAALLELVDGCEMDIRGTTYATFGDLRDYCTKVAGSVGRLSLAIYSGERSVEAMFLANELGIALQVTNILRDIKEDRDEMGRIYIPAEDIVRFGCNPDLTGPPAEMTALISLEAMRAVELYETGLQLLPSLDRRSRACTAAMAGIYRRLLDRIVADPLTVLARRVTLPVSEKATVALRALVRGEARGAAL